ncbi:MAG: 5-(carboxyamino)imidazole ribonucleotide synthase [Actinomycetota bacterium]|nr:5-(carboxyamino)imidazole ribonucleotide synthase [Actinomycetota bacterium]MDQ1643304.1 5-(carboxyamino)imidazole ribonucleotide synthase [Actinomycetota bacterium]
MGFPVVGVVGGGQLARMMLGPAIALGVTVRVLARSADDSAARVGHDVEIGDERDLDALRHFAAGCDVLTFDHEHVPTEHLHALEAEGVAVRPGADALVHAQDKTVMRRRLTELGIGCPRWAVVGDVDALRDFGDAVGWPVVLKAPRGGYDGKGVRVVRTAQDADEWLATSGPLLAEERVSFRRELSALVARSPHGQAAAYPVVETVQVDGVCREVLAPAAVTAEHAVAAQHAALRIAEGLGVTGILAVEMFDTDDGVLVNELAMRPHNSGHWTIEGARTSQFEQHLRAVLDLPLGETSMTAPHVAMANVLGGDIEDMYAGYLHCMAHDPGVHLHMYGKDVRPGRKVGHTTALGSDAERVRARAVHAAAFLRGDIDG